VSPCSPPVYALASLFGGMLLLERMSIAPDTSEGQKLAAAGSAGIRPEPPVSRWGAYGLANNKPPTSLEACWWLVGGLLARDHSRRLIPCQLLGQPGPGVRAAVIGFDRQGLSGLAAVAGDGQRTKSSLTRSARPKGQRRERSAQ